MNEKPSYFSILTADVRYDERLRPNEKIMFSEITALSNKHGYCSACNTYFANLYKVHKDTISDWINNLKKYGYIKVILERKDGTKQIIKRKIYINHSYPENDRYPIGEITDTLSVKTSDPYRQKDRYPIGKNTEGNNTSINNINKNNTSINNKDEEDDWKQTIINEWNSLDNNIPKIKDINPNVKRYSLIQARINQYGLDEVLKAIKSIDQSAFLKGYKTDFRITFDWFIKPNNFVKVMEGNFLDKKKPDYDSWSDEALENDYLNIKRL